MAPLPRARPAWRPPCAVEAPDARAPLAPCEIASSIAGSRGRGQICVANLNPSRGQQLGKLRPVVVNQADELAANGSTTVIVLPLTTQVYPGFRRW